MHWHIVGRTDKRARELADRHYSRKKIGATEFCPPGNNIVLIVPDLSGDHATALWVSHRPDPRANLAKPRQDGFDYWDNPYFRNESDLLSSELINQALAITRYVWTDDYLPADGFHSFVNPKFIKPIKRRGELFYGYCFYCAGFRALEKRTSRKLIRYVMPLVDLLRINPLAPLNDKPKQLGLFT